MVEGFHHILSTFSSISLQEMDAVRLMDRIDVKFTFHISQLPKILALAKLHYQVFEIHQNRISDYKTLYYDTAKFDLYTQHHNGKLNRYKVRYRNYVSSNLGFLEVKFKTNKGNTIKSRIIENNPLINWNKESIEFLNTKTPYLPEELIPSLWINYSRITLVNIETKERITIDLNLEFEKDGFKMKLPQLIIAEVKQEKRKESAFVSIMKQLHIREGSISKYCMAMAFTNPNVKTNQFKEQLISIKNILNYDLVTN